MIYAKDMNSMQAYRVVLFRQTAKGARFNKQCMKINVENILRCKSC